MRYFFSLLSYRIFFLFLTPLLIVTLSLRSVTNRAYRKRILERLGIINNNLKSGGIIVHAASVGEVLALKSYILQLLKKYPNTPIILTTFTPTGSEQVKKQFADKVQHCYLPLDIWPCTWLFLRKLKPTAVILMETEIWPNFIAQCAGQKIPLQLINGRLSNKSINSYRKLSWLIKPTMQCFQQILCQSEDNQNNFIAMGAKAQSCSVSGNLKFDIELSDDVESKTADLQQKLAEKRTAWLVASTHPNDEALILATFQKLLEKTPDLLLILVPRHPERFANIEQLCLSGNFSTVTRSSQKPVQSTDNIWLIDTLGELLACFPIADIVTMGGSFSEVGGHNPLEPAMFNKPVVVGENMSNFRKVTEQLLAQKGLVQLPLSNDLSDVNNAELLATTVSDLLDNPTKMKTLGDNANQVVLANQGASKRSVEALQQLLKN